VTATAATGLTAAIGGAAAGATAAGVATAVGGAIAGAAGSIASQGVGVATGIQDKFSFKQVGLAALRNAFNPVQFGGGQGANLQSLGRAFAGGAARNAVQQGAGLVFGGQFSFKGVAAAGLRSIAGSGGLEGGSPGGGIVATADAIAGEISALETDGLEDRQLPNAQQFQAQPIEGFTPSQRLAQAGQGFGRTVSSFLETAGLRQRSIRAIREVRCFLTV